MKGLKGVILAHLEENDQYCTDDATDRENLADGLAKKLQGLNEPKYRIGDHVLYNDRYNDDEQLVKTIQSNIVESWSLTDGQGVDWYYHTEETLRNEADPLDECEVIKKL